jgi:hypothetical protein
VYQVLADLVVLLHFAFVAFAVLGGLLVLRWPRLAWLHLPAVAWVAYIEFYQHYCPLTPLENRLRDQAGLDTYSGGFIDHYIMPLIYPPGLTPGIQLALGVILALSYIVIYAVAWRRHRHSRRKSGA